MSRRLLQEHISPLVDRLRAGEHTAISLPDVAALTEILMRSLESYFKSIDLTIYQECQSLADYIDDARLEIASLSPEHSDSAKIPRAGLELDAIVKQTESATHSIMTSAERIMEADPADQETFTTTINDSVMQIFEACSFQDITGQRISKVVKTLEHVEERVARLINILGVLDNGQSKPTPDEIDEDKALLHGPALEGEGIDQSAVDDLLSDPSFDNIEAPSSQNSEPEASSKVDATQAPTPAKAPEPQPKALTEGPAVDPSGSDDIDFTFDGQGTENNDSPTPPLAHEPDLEPNVEVSQEATAEEDHISEEPVEEVEEKELNMIEKAKKRKADARAEQRSQRKPAKPVQYEENATAGLNPKSTGKTTQSDIDALFS